MVYFVRYENLFSKGAGEKMEKFRLKDLSPELIKSFIVLKTKDEVIALAHKNNLDISDRQAERILQVSENNHLSLEELDKVVGGTWVDSWGNVHTES